MAIMILSALLLLCRDAACFQIPLSPEQPRHLQSTKLKTPPTDFLGGIFESPSECDDSNTPPSLSIVLRSISELANGSDIRGKFVDHVRVGSFASVAHAIGRADAGAFTPFSAYVLGHAFGTMVRQQIESDEVTVCVGTDPRSHGIRLADAFSRGVQAVDGVQVVYTGLATTPSMMEYCRAGLCQASAILTASHLPSDRNGIKFFVKDKGGLNKSDIQYMISLARQQAVEWQNTGIIPPTSGEGGVFCSQWVNFMPFYAQSLRDAIYREVVPVGMAKPLEGLKIVLNAGNGAGGFFTDVLKDLGADVSGSIHLEPDSAFSNGVPNPEREEMIQETIQACEKAHADLGILLDTDADRSGFVVPRSVNNDGTCGDYEALNRNRLIALLSIILSETSPGSTVVTDSVTSEGLSEFLNVNLGLKHVRYLRGYANVIAKARELSESGVANAEMAIETSGHCAMAENDYLDDGTYTAVKIIGLLARVSREHSSLLDLIRGLKEMDEVKEMRLIVLDGSLVTTAAIFDFCALEIERMAAEEPELGWSVDGENLEGIRLRFGGDGGFFMIRRSLHDPVLSMQVEGESQDQVQRQVIDPLLKLFESEDRIGSTVDLTPLKHYS